MVRGGGAACSRNRSTLPEYASVFRDSSVVRAYHHRPPYQLEAIEYLAGLVGDTPRAVLDVGCGTGDIARPLGEHRTGSVVWEPTIDDYIECRHSQNGLSRDRMGDDAVAFDAELRALLEDLVRAEVIEHRGKRLQLTVTASIVWGVPGQGIYSL